MKGKGKENFLRDSTLAGEVEIFIYMAGIGD
jgi:hypothetical protein